MRRAWPYALFLTLVCVFLWKPIFTGQALLPGDYLAQMSPWGTVTKAANPAPQWNPLQWDAIAQFYPWRVFYARSMESGHIPLWNPHQFCGTPFLANGQSAVLYPPNLVFLLFDPITSFTILAALHLFLAASFMYMLLRGLGCKELGGIVGGITYAFSAFMVLWLELPTFVGAASWLPLVLLLVHQSVEKRSVFDGMLAGLALAMAVLAGHMQIAFYVGFAAALWWIWKLAAIWRADGKFFAAARVGAPLAAFVAMAGLITAPQVLPTLELARSSPRAGVASESGYDWFIGNAVRPYRLVTAFAPRFFGDPSAGDYYLLGRTDDTRHVGSAADYMEYGLYAGILPLVLAMIALSGMRRRPHVAFFSLLALLSLLVATGTSINELFYYAIPGFTSLGGPNRILLLYFLGIAALAGFGAELVCTADANANSGRDLLRRALRAGVAALIAVSVLYGVTYSTAARRVKEMLSASADVPGWNGSAYGLILLSAFVLLICGMPVVRRAMLAAVVVGVVVVDLFAFGMTYNPTCDRAKVYPKTKLTTELQRLTRNSDRIAPINPKWSLFETPEAILPPNAAMVYGLYDVQGYDSLYTRAYKDMFGRLQGVDPSPPENGNMVLTRRYSSYLETFARYVVTEEPILGHNAESLWPVDLVDRVDGLFVYRLGFQEFYSPTDSGEDTFHWAVSNRGRDDVSYPTPNSLSVRWGKRRSGFVGPLYAPVPSYPGWTARTDRQVAIDSGSPMLALRSDKANAAIFVYEPLSFRLGLFLACLGVSTLVGTWSVNVLKIRSRR